MKLDRELSQQIAEANGAINKRCWRNAFLGLGDLPGAVYVEGWVVTHNGMLAEHGWLEFEGRIVDPTPVYLENPPATYFPGLRFSAEEARQVLETRSDTCEPGDLPLAWRFGWGGMDAPEYRAAFEAAWAYVKAHSIDRGEITSWGELWEGDE
jgi:hypothetical protein